MHGPTDVKFALTSTSQFIYFCKTLYMFQTGFPSIIRSSKLHIERQAFVRPLLLPAASLLTAGSSNVASCWLCAENKLILIAILMPKKYNLIAVYSFSIKVGEVAS